MILMVATMGPIELLANRLNKKPNAATVLMASAAKAKAPQYLQKISFSLNSTT